MVLKSTFTFLAVAALAVFTTSPVVEAHSWADCIDWKFNNPKKPDWSDKGGKCQGYARRFPLGKAFGSLDSAYPNRHYQQNHAKKNEPNNMVQINLSKARNGKDISQQELLKNTIARLPYKNCMKGSNEDRRACGGCFKVPVRASGTYLLQWRWMLNKNEWYTSCADVQIGK
ncbi:hypothetical protein CPC16_012066 [Podila verticillata]|nr:hypothetical protein CPC16_012066 [Podila verticillata]